jgi:hypothetical protein
MATALRAILLAAPEIAAPKPSASSHSAFRSIVKRGPVFHVELEIKRGLRH